MMALNDVILRDSLKEGGEWGYVSASFFHQIRRSAKIFVQIRNHNHIRKQKFKGNLVNVNTRVNFLQLARRQYVWFNTA